MKEKISALKQILVDLQAETQHPPEVNDSFIKGLNILTDMETMLNPAVVRIVSRDEKQLYATVKDNIDGDRWILGPARDGGMSAVLEWITAELEDTDDEDAVETQYTIGFVMMSEEEAAILPEP